MVKKSIEIRHYQVSLTKPARLLQTDEFESWYKGLNLKTKAIVNARFKRIREEGYFGWVKKFDGLTELKWTSGLRIYVLELETETLMILLGGNKNAQEKDIKEAKKIAKIYSERVQN